MGFLDTLPDTDTLDDLDFEVPCGRSAPPFCDNPATWRGICVCGHDGLRCQYHRDHPEWIRCTKCGGLGEATIMWVRLPS